MTINEYRNRYYKVFKTSPNVMLVFVQLFAAPLYYDVTNCVFVDEVVSITKKDGIKAKGLIGYFF
jgi:hypothetical protein